MSTRDGFVFVNPSRQVAHLKYVERPVGNRAAIEGLIEIWKPAAATPLLTFAINHLCILRC